MSDDNVIIQDGATACRLITPYSRIRLPAYYSLFPRPVDRKSNAYHYATEPLLRNMRWLSGTVVCDRLVQKVKCQGHTQTNSLKVSECLLRRYITALYGHSLDGETRCCSLRALFGAV